jgi:SHS2 domain-containing protein
MEFEILEHPADIGFRARGRSLAELFVNCAHALVAIILDPCDVRPVERVAIQATGIDSESLLVNWLNEVLFFVDGRRVALGEFAITRLDQTAIDCIASGETRDPERHPARLVVKAVTYHQLRIDQKDDAWVADVYLDI